MKHPGAPPRVPSEEAGAACNPLRAPVRPQQEEGAPV